MWGHSFKLLPETIKQIVHEHNDNNRAMTVLTAIFEDPEGYGRIIRDHSGNVRGIVEHSDATSEQLRIKEINTGIYCF